MPLAEERKRNSDISALFVSLSAEGDFSYENELFGSQTKFMEVNRFA